MNGAQDRQIEGNSRLARAATQACAVRRRSRPPARRACLPAARTLPVVLLAALLAAVGCSANVAETDPLASIADAVSPEERTPPPLAEVWRRVPQPPLTLRPAVGETNVYLALGNRLEAWSVVDGSLRWAPVDLDSDISAPPVALGGQVIVATRGVTDGGARIAPRLWWFDADGTPLSQEPLDGTITEIDAVPGTVLFIDEHGVGRRGDDADWHTPLEGAATVTLAADLGLALVTTTSGGLHAFDVADGTPRWRHQAGDQITRAHVWGGRVYVGAGQLGVRALRAADGQIDWERRLGTAVLGAPAVAGEWLWAGAFDAKLHAFKASNGTEMGELLVDLSSRNYLDVATFEPWVVVGPAYGPWMAVRGPTPAERVRRATAIRVQRPSLQGLPDLTIPAGTGPGGVAVVTADGALVLLQPQRSR